LALFAAFFLSFGPALAYSWIIYWTDRYEKEPLPLLLGVFIWGSFVAAGAAYLLNSIARTWLMQYFGGAGEALFAQQTLAAPFIEELLKVLAVLIVFFLKTEEFDSIIDGIVYSGITAIGFAATENMFYLYQGGYLANGWDGLYLQFFFRVILGAWNHLLYTSLFGIGLAVARLSYRKTIKVFAPILGFIAAFSAHAIHNTFHTQAEGLGVLILVIFVDWLTWFALALLIIWALRQERLWVFNEMLSEVARGTLTNQQYVDIISPQDNYGKYFKSLIKGNYREQDSLIKISTELAYKKHQLKNVGLNKGNSPLIIEKLRKDLSRIAGND